MMQSIKLKYIVFAFLVVFSGCRKDEKTERQIIKNPTGSPTIEVESGVTGLVVDENNNPVSNAAVRVYNKDVTTDENGIFFVNNKGLKQTNSIVHVGKAEYFDGFKSFFPAVGKKSFVKIQMVSKGSGSNILSSEGGVVDIDGGAELILPANSVVINNGGGIYTGEIIVYAHWYDPTDLDLGVTMPGNLLGIATDETEVQLGTYGMLAVNLESSEGVALQLANNAKATLKFPVPNNLDPPNTIALWSFDESDGVWIQEGNATLENGSYIAEVSHFSFWNCDAPFPVISLEGKLFDKGFPATNFPVTISVDNLISGYGFTDNEGVFRGKVPKGENLTMTLRHCGQTIYSQDLGIFDEDVTIADIDLNLESFITAVQGRMIGCDFEPLQSAYGLLRSGDDVVQVITPISDGTDADGMFSSIVAGCQNGNYTIQFFDPENIRNTGIMDISTTENVNNLGDVMICEEMDEFIVVTRDGNETVLFDAANVYYSNEEKLIIRSYEPNSNLLLRLEIFAQEEGDHKPSNLYLDDTGGFGSGLITICGDDINNFYDCSKMSVVIDKFDDYIEGTFSGLLVEVKDSLELELPIIKEYSVDGSFRLKIDEFINTGEITGKIWLDENDNDIRDEDESNTGPFIRTQIRKLEDHQFPIYSVPLRVFQGFYKFTNLLPGNYIVEMEGTSGFFVVNKDVGSDDRDCDFSAVSNGSRFETDEINISSNEIIENVDLGFQTPDSLICGNMIFEGCSPSIQVTTIISSGLPPFTASLNGGDFISFGNVVTFNVPEGGQYIIEVFDSNENSCTSSGLVNNFNNQVSGRVWRDIDGGIPNFYDSIDEDLSDIIVQLFNENGEFVTEELSNNGLYMFNNVSPGTYFVEIVEIGSFEVVTQNTDIDNGSDINTDTRRSDVFTVSNCNFSIQIDAGLK